jgi:hypothetical protein
MPGPEKPHFDLSLLEILPTELVFNPLDEGQKTIESCRAVITVVEGLGLDVFPR